jgi:uncharacterized protein involved in exopolysaccharide biosynthesis/Mrp family chromosome partitioning ATPase
MPMLEPESARAGVNMADVLFVLFKHKRRILLCALVGIAAAVAYLAFVPPVYQSNAKLLVRYVVDRSPIDPVQGSQTENPNNPNKPNESVINSEVEILNSWDLFKDVATQVGPERILPGKGRSGTIDDAAITIGKGIKTVAVPKTNVILILNKNSDPRLATEVLDSLLKNYFNKHLDIHRSKEAFKVVSEQADMFRGELASASARLKAKKAEANVISLKDSSDEINAELSESERLVSAATTALVQQRALVQDLRKLQGVAVAERGDEKHSQGEQSDGAQESDSPGAQFLATGTIVQPPTEDVERYKAVTDEIASLEKKAADLRLIYTDEARSVKANQTELSALQRERQALLKKYPDLVAAAPAVSKEPGRGTDVIAESARLAALEAGMRTLEARLHDIRERAKKFSEVAPEIEDLQRYKALQEANYASASSKLENARVDEALDPSKIPNISVVQRPSPALRIFGGREKTAIGLACGGLILALGTALLIELVFDQSVKRPVELEHRLDIPMLISIPVITKAPRKSLLLADGANNGARKVNGNGNGNGKGNGSVEIASWDSAHFIRPYSEVIRDRLGLYFEVNGVTHKPKLIAVAGSRSGAGASTLAGGLAAALSDSGEVKVLLVDMHVARPGMHPFFQGRPVCSLTSALNEASSLKSAANNLYLATAAPVRSGEASIGLKRFHDLMPQLQTSEFDYVIFDMPPLSEMNATAQMAMFMDKFVYVVEAERSPRDLVKRVYSEIGGKGRNNIAVVLNKTQRYGPRWATGGAW